MHRVTSSTLSLAVRLSMGLLALGLAAGSACIQAQTVSDGSFEASAASATMENAGVGWTMGNPGASYVYSNSFGHGTTPYGSQWLLETGGGVSQTISGFTVGQPYELFLEAADIGGGTLPILNLGLSGGATASRQFTLPQGGAYYSGGPIVFTGFEVDFTPTTTAPVTLYFSGEYPLAIDAVSIVPEPSTWALLLGGCGLLGVMWRRRQSR